MTEVNSIEALVAGGEQDVRELAERGNSLARTWLTRLQQAPSPLAKLALFGDMRVALMHESSEEAQEVARVMFPDA